MPAAPLVPVLDLDEISGDELVAALATHSCVFLRGHGLSDELLDGLLGTAGEFFALAEAEKSQVQWNGEPPWRGWQPVYASGPTATLMERFEVTLTPGGHIDADGNPAALADWAATFDQWPARPDGMVDAWSGVYAHLHSVASTVATLIAGGLDATDADLAAWTTGQHANLVVNHYLAQDEPPSEGRVRQRPHTDIGGITLLWSDDAPGGLEARIGPDGEWVPITPPPGMWLLQAGDLLHQWSRGRIPANDHRVVNPPRTEGVAQVPRYSVAYFHHPDLTTSVGALDHIIARQVHDHSENAAVV